MTLAELCPICGSAELAVVGYDGMIRARDGTQLPYHAQHSKCNNCGEEFFTKRQSQASNRTAAAALRAHAGLLTPTEIVGIRAKYDVTQTELERVLKLGKKTVVRWEAGSVCQSQAADQLLREIRDSPTRFYELAEAAGVSLRPATAMTFVVGVTACVRVTQGSRRPHRRKRRPRQSGVYRTLESASKVVVTRGTPVPCLGGA
jgi:putative zinc finger/helix-turn-helix YgiT family protein